MILPHDANKSSKPRDAKAFGAFIILFLLALGLVIVYI